MDHWARWLSASAWVPRSVARWTSSQVSTPWQVPHIWVRCGTQSYVWCQCGISHCRCLHTLHSLGTLCLTSPSVHSKSSGSWQQAQLLGQYSWHEQPNHISSRHWGYPRSASEHLWFCSLACGLEYLCLHLLQQQDQCLTNVSRDLSHEIHIPQPCNFRKPFWPLPVSFR